MPPPAVPFPLQRVAGWPQALFRSWPLTSFVVITFAWSWGWWLPLLMTQANYDWRIWKYFYVSGLSGPLVSSIAMSIALSGKQGLWSLLKQAFIWRFSVIWYLVALLLAPLLMLSAASYCAMAVHEDIALPRVAFGTVLLIFLIMVVRGGPVNEELGWRGYLLPHLLQRHNPFWATLVLTPIWTAWHGPLWLMRGVPHSHWPWIYFAMMVAPIAFLFTWFYLRTGRSVLIAILFHGSINTSIHFLPLLPPRHPDLTPFGIWIALLWTLTLAVLWADRQMWFSRNPQVPKAAVG